MRGSLAAHAARVGLMCWLALSTPCHMLVITSAPSLVAGDQSLALTEATCLELCANTAVEYPDRQEYRWIGDSRKAPHCTRTGCMYNREKAKCQSDITVCAVLGFGSFCSKTGASAK